MAHYGFLKGQKLNRMYLLLDLFTKTSQCVVIVAEGNKLLLAEHHREQNRLNELVVKEEAQRLYIAYVCHEIRNPFNGIHGYIESFKGILHNLEICGALSEPPEILQGLLSDVESMDNCAKHIGRILDNTLDLAKLEKNALELNPQECDLVTFLNETVHIVYRYENESKAVPVQSLVCIEGNSSNGDKPLSSLTLKFDQARLRQVLLNLLSNAVTHTEMGFIQLKATVLSNDTKVTVDESRLLFEVRDSGPGIPPDMGSHI
ncbi:hypothetical protein CYMTET_12255 [Cymbomonas tetramitiformis]|uniref:histidine kinase n=1 Tax=Cymbomonas tetramitiformis TaxID=36881 RepID=A0AAE0GKV1_9CHLO|nr:hypothetical protein CYMTET_12255 [Cymbomonas tetramitiformis]